MPGNSDSEAIKPEDIDETNDISEKNDLSQDMPEKVKELNEEIMIWLRKTNAKIPRANPDFVNK